MNIYKSQSQYNAKGLYYASEIFTPGHILMTDVLAMRALPDEELTSEPILCVHNKQWVTKFELHKQSVAWYIYEKKYVDACHRLMYLALIMGEDRTDLFDFLRDDGLMHELLHLKSYYADVRIPDLVTEANEFEKTVPGTFLWATSQVKS